MSRARDIANQATTLDVDGGTIKLDGNYPVGTNNVALGNEALDDGSLTGGANTAVGANALTANTTGERNIAVGSNTLVSNTTGTQNVAIGTNALDSNTTGRNNVAIGYNTLNANTTANSITAVGFQSLAANTTGIRNTSLGAYSGFSATTATDNVFIGGDDNVGGAGYNTTGSYNTFVGSNAGYQVTTGAKNTILGRYNGDQGGLDARTRNNEILMSDGDGYIMYRAQGGIASRWVTNDGAYFYPAADNAIDLGLGAIRWKTVYAANGTINTSDKNSKQDITDLDEAEKRVATAIKGLIKKFRFKDAVEEKGDDARIHVGVIAQEVKAAFEAEGLDPSRYGLFCSDTWYEVDGKPSESARDPYTAETPNAVEVTRLGIRYDELLAFVIAAI